MTEASFSEFVIHDHFYTSPNQQIPPPTLSFEESQSLPDSLSPTVLRRRVWAAQNLPYLPFILNSPFHGVMTSRLAIPPGQIPLENDHHGFHLPEKVAKSWKSLEHTCRQISFVLYTSFCLDHNVKLVLSPPAKPSDFSYFSAHSSEEKARSAISQSLDAFVILFCICFILHCNL